MSPGLRRLESAAAGLIGSYAPPPATPALSGAASAARQALRPHDRLVLMTSPWHHTGRRRCHRPQVPAAFPAREHSATAPASSLLLAEALSVSRPTSAAKSSSFDFVSLEQVRYRRDMHGSHAWIGCHAGMHAARIPAHRRRPRRPPIDASLQSGPSSFGEARFPRSEALHTLLAASRADCTCTCARAIPVHSRNLPRS